MASAAQVAKVLKKPGEDNDVEVTWEDQQRINTFGKLNNRLAELKAKHALKKKDKQALEDASNEIMLADDEDASSVMFAVGDSYVQLDKDSIENKLQEYGSEIDKEIGALNTELASIQEQMGQLKATLYAKFKNNINLESDD